MTLMENDCWTRTKTVKTVDSFTVILIMAHCNTPAIMGGRVIIMKVTGAQLP